MLHSEVVFIQCLPTEAGREAARTLFVAVRLPLGGGCVGAGRSRERCREGHPARVQAAWQPPRAHLSAETPA